MKIVQVVAYYPPHLGGMQNVVREISRKLAKRGHEVEVFTSDIGCKKKKLRSINNLKINYLRSIELAHTPIIPSLFFKLLTISKDSIVHVHVAQVLIPEIVFLVLKIRKIPYIVHFHTDVGPSGRLGFLLPLYKKYILKRILKFASRVVVLTKEYKGIINRKYGILEKITIIPNGVSEKFFLGKENFSSENVNLLFIGRLTVEKNVPTLIRAVSLMKNRVTLHIVGDGEMKEEIENTFSDKKIKKVILHGEKTGKDLVNFYKNANIFLLASDYEGLPLVLLEAMASGTPIIASDVRGIREFVGDTGVLINPPTSNNFAKAIDNLIEDKKMRKTLSVKGRKKARGYDWNRITEKFEEVYKEIINETKYK